MSYIPTMPTIEEEIIEGKGIEMLIPSKYWPEFQYY